MQEQLIVVLITAPSALVGEQIAQALLAKRLAACVNQAGTVQSLYHWQGAVHQDEETLLIVKSRMDLFEQLAFVVKSLHPYDVPEIIALPIVTGLSDYMNWIVESTG
jgi:periplasmic divalent cation tolerance protein